MRFAKFIPEPVRTTIIDLLEGEPGQNNGFLDSLEIAESNLETVCEEYELEGREKETGYLLDLRERKNQAKNERDLLLEDIECLHRLSSDLRLEESYDLLRNEFTDEHQWHALVHSAWGARIDYSKYRNQVRIAYGRIQKTE